MTRMEPLPPRSWPAEMRDALAPLALRAFGEQLDDDLQAWAEEDE